MESPKVFFTEVNFSNIDFSKIRSSNFSKDDFVFAEKRVSLELLLSVIQEYKLIICLIDIPEEVDFSKEEVKSAYTKGLLYGWGVKASPYLVIFAVPPDIDKRKFFDDYVLRLTNYESWRNNGDITSISGINLWQ